jgi:transcriptional regulator of acetoin/glycerol metabolism
VHRPRQRLLRNRPIELQKHRILSVGTVGANAPVMPSFEAARSFDRAPITQAATQGRADSELLPLAEVERRHILEVLSACHGNRSAAAKALGIDRKTLYRQLKRFEIEP